ncbi:hypothetical protein AMECASPLE_009967 [Ameca splendens]|uniref:Uncharacterized protein n=1 Tax=Ameca splendens TaxID=208324 RepID=A0ABV0XDI3_9TELE
MVAQLVAPLPCSKKVQGLTPGRGSICLEFASSPCAHVGSPLGTLASYHKSMTVRSIGSAKLPLCMNRCVHSCLSCVSLCCPAMDWRPVQGVPYLSPIDCWR